ncbi:MAG: hypothetical protein K9G62_01445 [Alphaproteobacteria bacterium]|nr:hypothetical protein [Alphaproteobacteria bacterium]
MTSFLVQPRTFLDMCADLWRARLYVAAGVSAGVFAAAFFLYATIPSYRAWMLVAPASPMNGAGISSVLPDDKFPALNALALRMNISNSSDFTRFENIFTGPAVAGILLQDKKIMEGLSQDRAFGFSKSSREWTSGRLSEYLDKRVRMEPVGSTAFRRLIYLHPNPSFGVYLLYNIHRAADDLIRQKTRAESTARIHYLQGAMNGTLNPDHRRALTALLLEQERLLMLVSAETSYAAAVVEPPVSGTRIAWPPSMLVLSSFLFVGAVWGFALHGILIAVKKTRMRRGSSPKAWTRGWSSNTNAPLISSQDAAE